MPEKPFDSQSLPTRVVIPSDLAAARKVEDQVLKETELLGYSPECTFAIRLSLEEAIVNAHQHGNGCDPTKTIAVAYRVTPQRVVICVRDQGEGFDPSLIPDPTAPDRLALPDGRGLMLMRSYLDKVSFNERGNEVQLFKERS